MNYKTSENIYFVLLKRVGILLLLFTFTRILFYLFNIDYFSELNIAELWLILLYGLRFDISAIVFINSLYIISQTIPFSFRYKKTYQKFFEIFFYITNSVALTLNCIDFFYFKFIFRRTTYDILQSVLIGDDLKTLFWSYVADYWYILPVLFFLIFLMVFLFKRTHVKKPPMYSKLKFYFLQSIWFVLIVGLSFVLFRGGFQLRPISIVNAAEHSSARNVPLIINTPFSIITTFNKSSIIAKEYFLQEQCKEIFNPVKLKIRKNGESFKNYNVVFIIVESLSKEYIGALNQDTLIPKQTSYTPFIDSLISQSLCFANAFANSKRSIEAIPAILSGIPSLMNNAYLTSVFSGNKINSLPILLKKHAYSSAFFHGGKNGTLNFDAYAKLAGFEHYFGKDEYNNDKDYDGKWGIYDEEFFQFASLELNKLSQPFVSSIFTLSSHHPYLIPPRYKNKFPKGTLEIHKSIGYADYSLRMFFKRCSEMDWYSNTLFVITADHSSLAEEPYYKNDAGTFAVPLIFYLPGNNLKGIKYNVCQQIDILPSVLHLLNYEGKYAAFGSSVFDSTAHHFSLNYLNNSYQLINDSILLQFDGEKSISCYDFQNDKMLTKNIIRETPRKYIESEKFIKAFIQVYNNRMLKNKLTETDEE